MTAPVSKAQQLVNLRLFSQLLLDARLSSLNSAARACRQSEARLAGLTVPDAKAGTLPEIASARAALNYQRWADTRRVEINLALSRQMSALIEAQNAAREAFGRVEALNALWQREKQRPAPGRTSLP